MSATVSSQCLCIWSSSPSIAIVYTIGISSTDFERRSPKFAVTSKPDGPYLKGMLWSPSYFAVSCGGAPINILKDNIHQQKHHSENGLISPALNDGVLCPDRVSSRSTAGRSQLLIAPIGEGRQE